MSPRPRMPPGSHGTIGFKTLTPGKVRARVYVRGRDGRRRELTATARTRGAAERAIARQLETYKNETVVGVRASMTIDELGTFWLERRARQRAASGASSATRKRPQNPARRRPTGLQPQSLAAYAAQLQNLISPTMGGLLVRELNVGLLDTILGDLEDSGISTAQARSALRQMLALAVRHGALEFNPMDLVEPSHREPREVDALDLEQVKLLRHAVLPETQRRPGYRGPNRDLSEVVDLLLGTGCRIGEVLALQWRHLDLDGPAPTVLVDGTLVEPRKGYVEKLHRQEHTKGRDIRKLILPEHVVGLLRRRRERSKHTSPNDAVFGSRTGTWLWPNNLRTRLREALQDDDELAGTTPHTLRRTVGTLIAHGVSLDAARAQLGHALPGVTGKHYVAARPMAPDLRRELDAFFA